MRFRRHGPPPDDSAAVAIDDPRTIVPDAARPLLRRLVGRDGSASDVAALALADVCNRRRLRPHPFDLPQLAAFAKAHGELLGASALAWGSRREGADKPEVNYFDTDVIDDSNWQSARPAARAAFIVAMRAREPERARALLETSFASDPAPVRARLLEALLRGLSAADAPFLESLAKDRAPTVRERAERLLTYIPGTASAAGRLHDLVERTKISAAGLLRRRKKLTLELPANLGAMPHAAPAADRGRRWAAEHYAGIGLDAMAAAFGLSVTEMIAAASDDSPLLALLARQASLEGRLDVLAGIVREHVADAWIDAIGMSNVTGRDADSVSELPDDAMAEAWCAAAIVPGLWPTLPPDADLDRLYGFLRRPLPPSQARELLRSRAFASLANPDSSVERLSVAVTALTPAPLRSELRAALTSLPSDETLRAMLLLDCLALIDPPTP